MMFRALTVFALLSSAFAGLVVGHGNPDGTFNPDDPLACGGGQRITRDVTVVGPPAGTPPPANNPQNTLYVVFDDNNADDLANQDTDKTYPFSIWKENNARAGLQDTAYECKYFDGHVYGVSAPLPPADHVAAHPELVRVDSDLKITQPIP